MPQFDVHVQVTTTYVIRRKVAKDDQGNMATDAVRRMTPQALRAQAHHQLPTQSMFITQTVPVVEPTTPPSEADGEVDPR